MNNVRPRFLEHGFQAVEHCRNSISLLERPCARSRLTSQTATVSTSSGSAEEPERDRQRCFPRQGERRGISDLV